MNRGPIVELNEFVRAIDPWFEPGRRPVRAHLAFAIRQAMSVGLLEDGARLPPERALAQALHVSRPTISAVVDDLRSARLLTSRQGSGTWVSAPDQSTSAAVPFSELIHPTGVIDLAAATAPDPGLLPTIRIDTADLLRAEPANGLIPFGLAGLRVDLAEAGSAYLPRLEADNVVVTSGAHHALALVVTTLVNKGDVVLVEDTTYGGLFDILRSNGAKIVGIERDADGPVPSHLADLLKRHDPAMTILVSSVHSPTGLVSPDDRCDELADVLSGALGHVVLDESYAEIAFNGANYRLAAALGERAIHIGSLSKSMWAGLRTGWIFATGDLCRAVVHRRWSQFDLGPGVASQLFAREALRALPELMPKRRESLRQRSDWLGGALVSAFGGWSVVPARGGLAMWIDLGDHDGREYALAAAKSGVAVLPGSACQVGRTPSSHIRVCFDRPITVLQEAVGRLERA